MHKIILVSLIFLEMIFGVITYAKEPPNLHFAQERIASYYDSGKYYHDVERIISHAKSCLKTHIKKNNGNKKTALILDIDETALTLVEDDHRLTCGMSPEEFNATVMKANAKAIATTLDLYNFAKAKGIAVFFVTGRVEALRAATIKNLNEAGYRNWDGLYLRSNEYGYKTIVPFKSSVRKLLLAKGYDIVGNIGDQKSDLIGSDGVKCKFKLPNPYYFVH